MSAAIWPDTLPDMIRPGYRLSPVEQSIRTRMEVGNRRLRRISAARGDSVMVEWKFSDAEMAAFRAWHGDEAWSLSGASDDIAGWIALNAAVAPDALTGPALQLADKLIEDTTAGQHRMQYSLVTVLDAQTVAFTVTLRDQGRSAVRVGALDRAGTLQSVDIDLADGTASNIDAGVSAISVTDRGNGWWRIALSVAAGTGTGTLKARIILLDGTGAASYTGDGTSGIAVCEVNSRLATGYDLFLPTDAAGNAIGAAGGAGWFSVPLAFGGGYSSVEARFEEPFNARILEGLYWHVSGRLEVRNA